MDSGALSIIENGKKRLDLKYLPQLAKVFSLDLNNLQEHCISEHIAMDLLCNNFDAGVLKLVEQKMDHFKNIGAMDKSTSM